MGAAGRPKRVNEVLRFTNIRKALKAKAIVAGALAVAIMVAAVAFSTGDASADSPKAKDFFGTVLTHQDGILFVDTADGTIDVPVDEDTQIRIPSNRHASLEDLAEGDRVGVSLEEQDGALVADKIVLIPGKTRFRHVFGTVTEVTEFAITIRRPNNPTEPITFNRTPTTIVGLRRDDLKLEAGALAVIVAVRDAATGELQSDAVEINILPDRFGPKSDSATPPVAASTSEIKAKIKGVFEGIDDLGLWTVNRTKIVVNEDTKVEDGFIVGQLIEVEAVLMPDGSLLAVQIVGKSQPDRQVTRRTQLVGVFERVEDRFWIVSGTQILVNDRTDTDGLPVTGQLVKVSALLLSDGTVWAREIENKQVLRRDHEDAAMQTAELKGTLQSIEDGNWIVNGVKFSVDENTELEGMPAIDRYVEVKAVLLDDGRLLALKIEAEDEADDKPKREVEFKGVIERIEEDGSIVINGHTIAVSVLTELGVTPKAEQFVKVKALLDEEGRLTASEIESEDDADDEDRPNRVKIEGVIDRINANQTRLAVNGIAVIIVERTRVKGDLTLHATIRVEGILQNDGSVLASEVKAEARTIRPNVVQTEISGAIDKISFNDKGDVTGIVVKGIKIRVLSLTKVEGTLNQRVVIEIKVVRHGGELLARSIKVKDDNAVDDRIIRDVKFAGVVEDVQRNTRSRVQSISVDGVRVLILPTTRIEGVLVVGAQVDIVGVARGEIVVATRVKVAAKSNDDEPKEIKIEGVVRSVSRGAYGGFQSVTVAGREFKITSRTEIDGPLVRGVSVEIKAILDGDTPMAKEIKVKSRIRVISTVGLVAVENSVDSGADEDEAEDKSGSGASDNGGSSDSDSSDNSGNNHHGDEDDTKDDDDEDDDSDGLDAATLSLQR